MFYSLRENKVSAIRFDNDNMAEFINTLVGNYRIEFYMSSERLMCNLVAKFNKPNMTLGYGDYIVRTGENNYCSFNSIDFDKVFM